MSEEEKIALECTRYGILRKKEVSREKMLNDFSRMEGLFKYDDLKTFSKIKSAINTAETMRWYENYNEGTSNAIMIDQTKVIRIPWVDKLIINFFEKYLSISIEYTYWPSNSEEGVKLSKSLDLDKIYLLFDSLAKNFEEDNRYSKEILEMLKYISAFEFHDENCEIRFLEGNVTTSFDIPKENTVLLAILRKLAL